MRLEQIDGTRAAYAAQLREARLDARLSQTELASRMGVTQSFISKCERGARTIDLVELRHWCRTLAVDLTLFVTRAEALLEASQGDLGTRDPNGVNFTRRCEPFDPKRNSEMGRDET